MSMVRNAVHAARMRDMARAASRIRRDDDESVRKVRCRRTSSRQGGSGQPSRGSQGA